MTGTFKTFHISGIPTPIVTASATDAQEALAQIQKYGVARMNYAMREEPTILLIEIANGEWKRDTEACRKALSLRLRKYLGLSTNLDVLGHGADLLAWLANQEKGPEA